MWTRKACPKVSSLTSWKCSEMPSRSWDELIAGPEEIVAEPEKLVAGLEELVARPQEAEEGEFVWTL